MVYFQIEEVKVKQYSSTRAPNGSRKYFSGKIEDKYLETLKGKNVFVRVKHKMAEYTFISKVKELVVGKYKIPYVSAISLAELIGETVDVDIIEIE